MPNYCYQHLTAWGDYRDLTELAGKLTDGAITDGTVRSGVYEGCVTCGPRIYDVDGTFLAVHLTSAWGPMTEHICELSRQHPAADLVLSYRGENAEYLGAVAVREGTIVEQYDIPDRLIPEWPCTEHWDDAAVEEWEEAIDGLLEEACTAVTDCL